MSIVSRLFRFTAQARARYLVVAALLAVVTTGVETAAAETQSAGPMPVANLTPFALTRLEPGVPRPLQGRIGEWSLDTTLSYGNTFIMSDNVRSYLQARDERRALDVHDLAALDATGQDYYYLDVNVTRMTLEASMRVTSRLAGFVRLPIIHSGGGHVDSFIEGFHDVFGVDSAGRDLVAHVIHNFAEQVRTIERLGVAEVNLGGRPFTIRRQFIEDMKEQRQEALIAGLRKALLIFHSPVDTTVSIAEAAQIYAWARHPKSFVSLENADHLLTKPVDAEYVADTLLAWVKRYLQDESKAAVGTARQPQ